MSFFSNYTLSAYISIWQSVEAGIWFNDIRPKKNFEAFVLGYIFFGLAGTCISLLCSFLYINFISSHLC